MYDISDICAMRAAPLAERMRCETLDDFCGQRHLVGEGKFLRRAILADRLGSCVFYGPPGTGKSALARIIASIADSEHVYLNAVASGVADAKRIIAEAVERLRLSGKRTYLILDECHRWNKAQSDSVLGAIEKGEIVFIGTTTENPFVSLTKALLSRCRLFKFEKLSEDDIRKGLNRAIADKENGLGNYALDIPEETTNHIAFMSNGDMRVALNSLELAVLSTPMDGNGRIKVTKEAIAEVMRLPLVSIDETDYYDFLSAFCKSLRGSDENAALYYAFRLIKAGCDPMVIFRRLVVHSAEDVGLADPNALNVAVSALAAHEKIGFPESKIPLAEAIIYVAKAPKSNSVARALSAVEPIAEKGYDDIPNYLRDKNYKQDRVTGYKYPHDYGGYVKQRYLPTQIADMKFYVPSGNGQEKKYGGIWREDP